MSIVTKGVAGKVRRIKQSLDAIERGSYSEFDIYRCCDYIDWLAKFKKVPEETWRPLCEQATRILDAQLDRWAAPAEPPNKIGKTLAVTSAYKSYQTR